MWIDLTILLTILPIGLALIWIASLENNYRKNKELEKRLKELEAKQKQGEQSEN